MLSHLISPFSTTCFAATSHGVEYQHSTESVIENTSDPKHYLSCVSNIVIMTCTLHEDWVKIKVVYSFF